MVELFRIVKGLTGPYLYGKHVALWRKVRVQNDVTKITLFCGISLKSLENLINSIEMKIDLEF